MGLPPIKNPLIALLIDIRTIAINRSRIRHAPATRADDRQSSKVSVRQHVSRGID
jgi:hypothetical protein